MSGEIGIYNITSTFRIRGEREEVEEAAQTTADMFMQVANIEANFYDRTPEQLANEFEFLGVTVERVFMDKGFEGE